MQFARLEAIFCLPLNVHFLMSIIFNFKRNHNPSSFSATPAVAGRTLFSAQVAASSVVHAI